MVLPDKMDGAILLKETEQQASKNKHVLSQIIVAIEFLAKQALHFRGDQDNKVDFSVEGVNQRSFIATLQFMAMGYNILNKYLLSAKQNAKYTNKIIQNEVVHIYAYKIRYRLTKSLQESTLTFTIIADETTDRYANGEILSDMLGICGLNRPMLTPFQGISWKHFLILQFPSILVKLKARVMTKYQ